MVKLIHKTNLFRSSYMLHQTQVENFFYIYSLVWLRCPAEMSLDTLNQCWDTVNQFTIISKIA